MSTKTTLKRVALVVVSALGFGLMSSVAPASATPREATSITVGTVPSCRVGASCSIPVTFTLPAATSVTADTFTIVAKVVSAPAASNSVGSPASGSVSAVTSTQAGSSLDWAKPTSGSGSFGTVTNLGQNATGSTAGGVNNWSDESEYDLATGDLAGQVTVNLKFTADASGSYSILVAAVPVTVASGAAATASIATLAGYTSASVAIATAAAPTSVTLTNVGGDAATSVTGSSGALLKISGAVLSGAESITLTGSTTTIGFSKSVLTASDFTNGVAYVNVTNSAAETSSVTASASGTLTGMTASSLAMTWIAPSTKAAPTLTFNSLDTTLGTGGSISGADVQKLVSTTRTSQPLRVAYDNSATTCTAAFKTFVNVSDISGKLTGQTTLSWSVPVSVACGDTYTDISFAGTLLNGQQWKATLYTTDTAADVAGTEGATRTATTAAIYPSVDGVRSSSTFTSTRAAAASTNTYFARITDQFGGGMAGRSVTVSLVGRNATASSTLVTDASGYVSYTLTDAGTSGTTDTLTFTDGSATKALTITYGTTTVTTLTLTGGDTTDGVTNTVKSIKDIAAGTSGAQAGTQTITATLKDASGALMSGVPVTWSVAGTGVAITSTQKL
ncbi:MAG: hypothetical protein EBU96_10245, partial [Actinobacteria bacterium]|nr:hypothetical protein [Actinomycetota bacterium]